MLSTDNVGKRTKPLFDNKFSGVGCRELQDDRQPLAVTPLKRYICGQ